MGVDENYRDAYEVKGWLYFFSPSNYSNYLSHREFFSHSMFCEKAKLSKKTSKKFNLTFSARIMLSRIHTVH